MSEVKVSEAARAKLAEEVKFDILVGASEGDNDLKRSQVARTFICESSRRLKDM